MIQHRLLIDVSRLSPKHIKALEYFIGKFIKGAIEHGDIESGRKWSREILDEMVDKSFYEIFMILEMEDEKVHTD